ncbi:MAG: class I SAM-dependent methyltransferase, partial [Leptospiraceae bacterium]|nr:class I SAM-dependent methyltransferase [Leptospiraceae bacterium]
DGARRKLLPCFDDFYGIALQLTDTGMPTPRILELGAGTGLFSDMLLTAFPDAHLTLIDHSESMLNEARRRFTGYGEQVKFICSDYSQLDSEVEMQNRRQSFDAVVSALSIHHLDDRAKERLYARCYDWLKPGGRFINADQALGAGEHMEDVCQRDWLDRVERSGLERTEIDASIARRKLDRSARMESQLRWLRSAGFSEADVMYRFFTFGVFYARK